MPQGALVAEVRPFDMGMSDPEGQAAIAWQAGGFFTGLDSETTVRLIGVSEPFSAAPALEYIDKVRSSCAADEDWRDAGLAAYDHFMKELLTDSGLRSTHYYLVSWPALNQPASAILSTARDHFGTGVSEMPSGMPPLFKDCRIEGWYLKPQHADGDYMAIYSAYELPGSWTPTTIHKLLQLPFPLIYAVDVETYSPDKTERELQTSYNGLTSQLYSQAGIGGKDPRSESHYIDVNRAMQGVQENEAYHRIRMVIMIKAKTLRELENNRGVLLSRLASLIRLREEPCNQDEMMKYFTTTPTAKIRTNPVRMPSLSGYVGLLCPFGYLTRREYDGVLLGVDTRTSTPIIFDGFKRATGEGARPFHAVFLGQPGSGKTFTLNVLLHRHALMGAKVIVLDAIGNFGRLAESLGNGASYNQVAAGHETLNIMDILFENRTDQVSHVRAQVGLLLGTEEEAPAGGDATLRNRKRYIYTNDEKAAVGRCLSALYGGYFDAETGALSPAAGNYAPPLLENLCELMEQEPTISHLGIELRDLYVNDVLGEVFNRYTSVDTSFSKQATIFDVSGLDADYAPLIYMQLMALTNLWVRRSDRKQPKILAIDEFRIASRDPVIAEAARALTKLGRNFTLGVWTADQNPSSYTFNKAVQQILSLASVVFIGRQQGSDVDDNMALFQRLNKSHRMRMIGAHTGEFVTMLGDDAHMLYVRPSRYERAFFSGT